LVRRPSHVELPALEEQRPDAGMSRREPRIEPQRGLILRRGALRVTREAKSVRQAGVQDRLLRIQAERRLERR
jgi:hypothetical protein